MEDTPRTRHRRRKSGRAWARCLRRRARRPPSGRDPPGPPWAQQRGRPDQAPRAGSQESRYDVCVMCTYICASQRCTCTKEGAARKGGEAMMGPKEQCGDHLTYISLPSTCTAISNQFSAAFDFILNRRKSTHACIQLVPAMHAGKAGAAPTSLRWSVLMASAASSADSNSTMPHP